MNKLDREARSKILHLLRDGNIVRAGTRKLLSPRLQVKGDSEDECEE
jgi:hypothetical protein